MIIKEKSSSGGVMDDTRALMQALDVESPDLQSGGSKVERCTVPYKNLSDRYLLWGRQDTERKQYCNMYKARLHAMRPLIQERASKMFDGIPEKKLFEVEEDGEECVIVGTIYKQQELKPSVLKELSEQYQLVPQPVLTKYDADDDTIILEDELQRIQLVGENLPIHQLATGIVCGARGCVTTPGKFEVAELCFAGLPAPALELPMLLEEDRFMLLVSGLEVGGCASQLLAVELLADYITGQLGTPATQLRAACVVRVVVAGNSVCRGGDKQSKEDKLAALDDLDNFLCQIASCCPVDVMPGEFDPTNHVMPQQPLHRCLLPKAGRYSSMASVTNPYECMVGGRVMAGGSGQAVDSVRACSRLDDPLDVLEHLCRWGHHAPTAPDTLACFPFHDCDPFLLQHRPDIFFTANQATFGTRTITVDDTGRSVLLVSVPRFNDTAVCALVNLRTLTCQPLSFHTGCNHAR